MKHNINTERYGNPAYRVRMLKNYTELEVTYVKGRTYAIDGIDRDGIPYIEAGHGLAVEFPKDVATVIDVTPRLPAEVGKHITKIKRALGYLTNYRKNYYDDVFTTRDILNLEADIVVKLAALKKVKAPKRPKATYV